MKCEFKNCEALATPVRGLCLTHAAEFKELGAKIIAEIGAASWRADGRARVRQAWRAWGAFFRRGGLSEPLQTCHCRHSPRHPRREGQPIKPRFVARRTAPGSTSGAEVPSHVR